MPYGFTAQPNLQESISFIKLTLLPIHSTQTEVIGEGIVECDIASNTFYHICEICLSPTQRMSICGSNNTGSKLG